MLPFIVSSDRISIYINNEEAYDPHIWAMVSLLAILRFRTIID